jgi:hypothetical protein
MDRKQCFPSEILEYFRSPYSQTFRVLYTTVGTILKKVYDIINCIHTYPLIIALSLLTSCTILVMQKRKMKSASKLFPKTCFISTTVTFSHGKDVTWYLRSRNYILAFLKFLVHTVLSCFNCDWNSVGIRHGTKTNSGIVYFDVYLTTGVISRNCRMNSK